MNPERPRSNGTFWTNAFERVMTRDGKKTSDWQHMSITQRARMTIKLVVYPVQYMPYIGDKIDRNRRGQIYKASLKVGMEDFGDALGKLEFMFSPCGVVHVVECVPMMTAPRHF